MLLVCLQGQARFQLYQKLAALVFALVQVTMGWIDVLFLLLNSILMARELIISQTTIGCHAGSGPAVVHPAVRG